MIDLGRQLDQTDKRGNYTRMGIIPWDGQGFHATWGLIYGAKYFDQKTCQVTPQEPAFEKAYGNLAKWSKEFGYQKVQAYGVTYLPVPKAGDPPMTWAGGFGLVMPSGGPNPELTWKFMKFYAGEQGQRLYTEAASKIPTWKALLDDKNVTAGAGDLPRHDAVRDQPALPVGAQISDAMDAAQQGVLLGEETPDQALGQVYDRVQPQMQQFCPFTLEPVT